jgi:hypothetical protein
MSVLPALGTDRRATVPAVAMHLDDKRVIEGNRTQPPTTDGRRPTTRTEARWFVTRVQAIEWCHRPHISRID